MAKLAVKDKTAVKKIKQAQAEPQAPAVSEAPVCVHRWVIEAPNGETSRGTCRYCGAEKQFPNSAEDWLFERDVPLSRWTGRTEYKPGY